MDDSELSVLARRILCSGMEVPLTAYFAALFKFVAAQEPARISTRLESAARNRRRVLQGAWLWPCDYIPEIEAALRDPTLDRLRAAPAFFRAVALIQHLHDGRKVRKELTYLFPQTLPFALIALAHLARRPRSLTPRPSAGQAKDISDVEFRIAWHLWRIAETVHQELSKVFALHGVARVCKHCGQLFIDLKKAYCTERCRKAYHDAKLYRKSKTEFPPGLTNESPAI